jgi:hypothetical protein
MQETMQVSHGTLYYLGQEGLPRIEASSLARSKGSRHHVRYDLM